MKNKGSQPFRPLANSSQLAKRDSELESLLHSTPIVQIEKMAVGGEGVARIPFKEKSLVVFVDRVAPNEKVKIEITSVEKTFLKGRLIEVIEASASRRKAPCVYFEECGGCSWQHFNEEAQVQQKELLLKELLQKFIPEKVIPLEPTICSEQNFNYRNRIQLKQQDAKLGYFKKGTHEIVDIESCLIADPKISEQIPILKKKLKPSGEIKKYELRLTQENVFESYRIGDSGEGLAFSQVNNTINAKLVEAVMSIAVQANPATATELYSGSGNFSFELLSRLKSLSLECVELNAQLTQHAAKRVTDLGLQKRVLTFTANCDHFVERRPLSEEFILLDPPRAGCSEVVVQKLAEAQPKNIVYVSCHPVYLARDLKRLFQIQPNYKIEKLQIFDMFPQTDHFETLVHLSLT